MMLEESGTVVALTDGQLVVETVARSSCSKCSSSGCSTSVIARLFGLKRNRLTVDNTLGAGIGDRVVIGIPDAVLVKASIWAYLVPLAGMLFMSWMARSLGAPDLLQALCALFGLAGGLYAVNRVTGTHRRRRQFTPLLLRMEGQPRVTVELTELIDF